MAVELWFPVPVMVIDVEPAVREATRTKVLAYLDSERGKRDVPPAPSESVSTSYFNQKISVIEDAADGAEALDEGGDGAACRADGTAPDSPTQRIATGT